MPAIQLSYGETGLRLDLDDARFATTVILPADPPAHADPKGAFAAAVARPLGARPLAELGRGLKPGARVAIAIADHTRSVPDRLLVPWIVEALGVRDEQVVILVGTGTHRGSTPDELKRMLGDAVGRFRIINHDCQDPELVLVGRSSCGGECWLNRAWVEADCRIGTGFIEPHFFAGFSGGSKAIVPGIAGLKTIQHFHRSRLIAHPGTTWGDVAKNPLQALTREMTALCPPHFIVNVTLNLRKEITAVFAGETITAHDAGCRMALHEAMQPVARRFPVVVTTNSGYPLDQNFYQTVKGISAASRIVERGGTIVVASRCNAGLPNEGEFRTLLSDPRSSSDLLKGILANEKTPHDQWQVQTLLQCLEQAEIVLYSSLPPGDRSATRTRHSDDLGRTLDELRAKHGAAKLPVAVMPMGPLTIPVLQAAASH